MGALALTAGALGVASGGPAQAAPSTSAPVVINEVYGGGGNTSASFDRDFVELVNVSSAAVDLSGWSVQYNSTAGTGTWQKTDLTGSLPAGASFVVGEGFGADRTLPDVPVDVSGGIAMSATGGKVALVRTTTALGGCTTVCSQLPEVVDFVGWGAANDAATAPAPATSNPSSITRDASHTNTANNQADFAVSNPPTPTACGDACTAPPGPEERSIAQIQGTGSSSPLVGQTVRTQGVVTAAYPIGGFRGFYLQTQGTGPEADPTGASDGIFVFQPSGALDPDAVVGNFVEVTGTVSEFQGLTELTAASADIVDAGDAFSPVQPLTIAWPTTNAGRESIEGMLFQPLGDYTVTNTFSTNQFGEVGLAVGTKPLLQPTEVARPGSPEVAAVAADNLARAVTLDDGISTNYLATNSSATACSPRPAPCLVNGDLTPAYLSNTAPVRVGEAATFTQPVVVDFRFDMWRFQPTVPVSGPDDAGSPVSFSNTRTPAPDAARINRLGTADLRVASFNVLNFFTDLGDENASCTAFYDRDGSGNNVRGGCDERGAWDPADLARQQEKEVSAITALGADVVGLMEIENSAKFGHPRDETLSRLVGALNARAGAGTWAFVPSSADLPPVELQDFITSAIIYKPATVMRVDRSWALGTASAEDQAFGNAREPIGQVFKKKTGKGDKFLFVVNHFKSKGSAGPFPPTDTDHGDADTHDGQGASVTSRVKQAEALRDWVPPILARMDTRAVVMAGDYNSYTEEDPLQVLYSAGYTDVGSHFDPGKYSYSFSGSDDFGLADLGLSGSLDHILVNDAGLAMSTGADHWNINAGESVAMEYSRFNYHRTNFHDPGPYRSSDHDPVVLGLRAFVR